MSAIQNPKSKIQNLIIRPPRPTDAEDLHAIAANPTVARTLIQLPSMELTESLEWVQKKQPGRHRLIVEIDGRVIASGSITQYQNPRLMHSGHLGLGVHPDYWGQGVGTALTTALLDLADNWLNLKRVELDVFTHNEAAIHIYQKLGFEIEGTRRAATFGDGRFLDEYRMARLRAKLTTDNSPRPAGDNSLLSPNPLIPASSPSPIQNLIIRTLRTADILDINTMWRHPAVDLTTLQLPSQELSHVEERLNSRAPGIHRFGADLDGRIIGMVSIHIPQNPRLIHSGGLGMMVHPDYWGQGVGSRLMEAILDLADNWLNLKRVELDVNTDNPAGVRLYQKFGFVTEGRKRLHAYGGGRWADSYFMARIKE